MGSRALPSLLLILAAGWGCRATPQDFVEKGNRLFDAGRFDEAALDYRNAIQKAPGFGEAYYRLGLAELRKGRPGEAHAAFERAVELLPDREDARVQLADVLWWAYNNDARRPKAVLDRLHALTDLTLSQNPDSYDGLRLKAYLASAAGKRNEALALFDRANRIRPMQPPLVFPWVHLLLNAGEAQQAERLARELIQANPKYGPIYDLLYRHYLSTKRFDDAGNLLKLKCAADPKQPAAILQLAYHYARLAKPSEMKAALQPLLDRRGDFPDGYLQAGDFYLAIRDHEQALRLYQEGAKAHPKDRLTYLKRVADLWLMVGEGERAAEVVAEILRQDPKEEAARAVQASLLLASGNAEKMNTAVREFRDLVSAGPRNAVWRFNLGRALVATGDLEGAAGEFEEAIRLRPDLDATRLALAQVSQARRDYPSALRHADEFLTRNPKSSKATLLRAVALAGLGQHAQARAALTSLERQAPGYIEVQYQLGILDLREKRFPAAEARFLKLYQQSNRQPRAIQALAETYAAANQLDKLSRLLVEVEALPGSSIVRRLLADTAARAGRQDLALKQYNQLLAEDPRSADLHLRRATVLQSGGDLAAALAGFQAARDLEPKNPLLSVLVAQLQDVLGHKEASAATYRRALELDPENPIVMNNLAFLLAETGSDLDEASNLAERAVRKTPSQANYTDTLGWVYLKKGMTERALRLFQSLAQQYPDNPVYRYHYGLALFQRGDRAKARKEQEAALASQPPAALRRQIGEALAVISRAR